MPGFQQKIMRHKDRGSMGHTWQVGWGVGTPIDRLQEKKTNGNSGVKKYNN